MEYIVHKTISPDWQRLPVAELRPVAFCEERTVKAWAQACHDGERLYLRLQAEEKNIVARQGPPLNQVWKDSCLEFFFAPAAEDGRYLNFEFNPKGAMYLAFGRNFPKRIRQLPDDGSLFAASPFRTENGWGLEFQVPAEFVQYYFPGFALRGRAHCNFYKCADESRTPHYLSWAALPAGVRTFHCREHFGTIVFEN